MGQYAKGGNSPQENVVALFADVGSQPQKLAIDTMEDGLEVFTLSGVFAVKKLQKLERSKGIGGLGMGRAKGSSGRLTTGQNVLTL